MTHCSRIFLMPTYTIFLMLTHTIYKNNGLHVFRLQHSISERRRRTINAMPYWLIQSWSTVFVNDLIIDSGSVRNLNWWVPNCYFKVPISCSFSTEEWVNLFYPKLMGSGTHCSKIDGYPGTHGTHANKATEFIFKLGNCGMKILLYRNNYCQTWRQ